MAGDNRTSVTYGRDTEAARTSVFVGASRVTLTSFEVSDTKLVRALVSQPGTTVIGSHRSTTPWEGGNESTYRTFAGNPRLREAAREPFGRMLHGKIGLVDRGGERRFFIGTGNLTDTGMGVSTPSRYNYFPGVRGDRTQFNYYVSGTAPKVVSQFEKVLGAIESDRTPVSTENLIVSSPNAPNALKRLASIIDDPGNKSALYIASATLTDPTIIQAIINKARRGDDVYVGLGGTKQNEQEFQRYTEKLLKSDSRIQGKMHVGYGERPWHANVMAMGDVFVLGSNRYSKAGLQGRRLADGSRDWSTEITYWDRDARVSSDLARNIRESFGFKTGAGTDLLARDPVVDYKFTRFGTYMPAMTPLLDVSASGRRDWAYIFDPSIIDDKTRRQYYWGAMNYPGQFRNPTTTPGRLMSHFYTEMYWAGNRKLPREIPTEVVREDQQLWMPTHMEVFSGLATEWARDTYGDRTAWWVNALTQKRGNRGPIGTALVNLGMTADKMAYRRNFDAFSQSDIFRPQEPKYDETFTSVSRFLADTAFDLGSSLGIANFTVGMAALWEGTKSRVGSTFRYANDIIQTAPAGARSPVGNSLAEGANFLGRIANWAYKTEANFTRSLIELLEPSMVAFRGDEGQRSANTLKSIYEMDTVSRRYMFSDLDLADSVANGMNRQGLRPTQRHVNIGSSTFYEVAWESRMTYLERFRLTSREIFRFMGTVPGFGWFANNIRVEADPYDEGVRHLGRRAGRELLTGQWGSAGRTARELWAQGQNAQALRLHLHGEGGPGMANVLARRGARTLMWGAAASWLLGGAMNAPYGTMEDQINAQNKIAEAATGGGKKGRVSYFGVADYAPQDVFDFFPAMTGAMLGGLAWSAQFVSGLTMGLGIGESQTRANKMVSIPKSHAGHIAFQEKAQARVGRLDPADIWGSARSLAGYATETLTAMARDTQMSMFSRRHSDLFYKVISKQMASTMQINEAMKLWSLEVAKLPEGEEKRYQQDEIERTLDQSRQWSGQRDKASVVMGTSQGLRVGHLGIFGFWGGSYTVGSKTTYMASVIGTMPFSFGLGIKLPFYYSQPSGRDNFNKWYNERLLQDNQADAFIRSAIDRTGGEYGVVGSAVKYGMGFGYEQGTNWEGMVRTGVDAMSIIQGSSSLGGVAALTAGSAYFAHVQAARSEAARGLTPLSWGERAGEYFRTGSSGGRMGYWGPSPYMMDNVAAGITNWTSARGTNPRFATMLGFALRAPGTAIRLPFMLPNAVAWTAGHLTQASGLGTALFGRRDPATGVRAPWRYNESALARGMRGYKTGVGLAMFGFMWYSATQIARAVDQSVYGGPNGAGPQAFDMQNRETAGHLARVPLIGSGLAKFYDNIVNTKNMESNNPEDTYRFATTPTGRVLLGDEAFASARRGRTDPSSQGVWNSLWRSMRQSFGMIRAGGFQTGEFTMGEFGPNWSFDQTADPDRKELNNTTYRFGGANHFFAYGSNVSMRIVNQKDPKDDNYWLAASAGATPEWLTKHMMAKKPAFMGKMFLASSAVYNTTPSLKIAMAVRYMNSRSALAAWPAESEYHAGERGRHEGRVRARQLNFVVYTATRLDDKGNPLGMAYSGAERVGRIMDGLKIGDDGTRYPAGALEEGRGAAINQRVGGKSSNHIFQGEYLQHRSTLDYEVEDDEDAMFSDAPRSPGSYLLRDPLTARSQAEFGLNFPNFQRTLYNQAIYFGVAGTLVGMALGGTAFRRVHERFFRRTVHGYRYHNSVEQRVERHAPVGRARVVGAVQAPFDDRFGAHGRWVLNATVQDTVFIELPGTGGHGVTVHGDAQGRPFTSTRYSGPVGPLPQGSVLRTGAEKAKFFADSYNRLAEIYTTLPHNTHTVGGAEQIIKKLDDALSAMRRSSAPGLPTGDLDDVVRRLNDLNARITTGRFSSARLSADHARELEELARGTLNNMHRLVNLEAADGLEMLRQTGMSGPMGWIRSALASFGLVEETVPSPHARARRAHRTPGPDVARVAHLNDPARGFAETRAMYADRLGYMGRMAGGAVRGIPRALVHTASRLVPVVNTLMIAPDLFNIAGGIGAEAASDDYLNRKQKDAFREAGTDSTLGLTALLGSAVAGAGAAALMTLTGAALVAIGLPALGAAAGGALAVGGAGVVAGLGSLYYGTQIAVPYALDQQRRARENDGPSSGWLADTARSWVSASEQAIVTAGRLMRNVAGSQLGNAIVHQNTSLQLNITNGLRTLAQQVRSNDLYAYWQNLASSTLMSLAGMTSEVIAPVDHAFPELHGNEEGHSFSLNPLWMSRSPIWWGHGAKGGTGWIKDVWYAKERPKQEHMRISADPIGSSLPEMVSPDTLGVMSGSNDNPLNINLKSLYMMTGRGSGGLGSVQAQRAFKWRPIEPVNAIIRRELERRAIMFEVGILGGVLRRREYRQDGGTGYAGGFVGRPSLGRSGAGPTRGGSGSPVTPAGGRDVDEALRSALLRDPSARFVGPLASQPRKLDPFFAEASKLTGIPEGVIRAIAKRETGFLNYKPTAVSPAGALGIMQTMPDWWTHGGDWRDPRQNILKGAQVIKIKKTELEGRLGHTVPWDMVAGAYNAGTIGVLDHGAMTRYKETRNYVALFRNDYYNSKQVDLTPEQKARIAEDRAQYDAVRTVMPEFLKGRTGMYLDTFLAMRLRVSEKRADELAHDIRTALYNQNRWLPMDDPAVWNAAPRSKKRGVGNASMGLVPNANDKANAIMEAAGMPRPVGLGRGAHIEQHPGTGARTPVIDGWHATFTAGWGDDRGTHRHQGEDVVYWRATDGGKGWTKANAPVPAYHSGVVRQGYEASGLGRYVELNFTQGASRFQVWYAHLSAYSIKDGQKVEAGQQLGIQGATGHVYGDPYTAIHTHIQYRQWNGERYVNISPYEFRRQVELQPKIDPAAQKNYEKLKEQIDSAQYRGFDVSGLMRDQYGMTAAQAEGVHQRYEKTMQKQGFYTGPTHEASTGKPIDIAQTFPNAGRTPIVQPEDGQARPLNEQEQNDVMSMLWKGVGAAAALWIGSKVLGAWSRRSATPTAANPTPGTATASGPTAPPTAPRSPFRGGPGSTRWPGGTTPTSHIWSPAAPIAGVWTFHPPGAPPSPPGPMGPGPGFGGGPRGGGTGPIAPQPGGSAPSGTAVVPETPTHTLGDLWFTDDRARPPHEPGADWHAVRERTQVGSRTGGAWRGVKNLPNRIVRSRGIQTMEPRFIGLVRRPGGQSYTFPMYQNDPFSLGRLGVPEEFPIDYRTSLAPGQTPKTGAEVLLQTKAVMENIFGTVTESRGIAVPATSGDRMGAYHHFLARPYIEIGDTYYRELDRMVRGHKYDPAVASAGLHAVVHETLHASFRTTKRANEINNEGRTAAVRYGMNSVNMLEEALTESLTKHYYDEVAHQLGFDDLLGTRSDHAYRGQRAMYQLILRRALNDPSVTATHGRGVALTQRLAFEVGESERFHVLARQALINNGVGRASTRTVDRLARTFKNAMDTPNRYKASEAVQDWETKFQTRVERELRLAKARAVRTGHVGASTDHGWLSKPQRHPQTGEWIEPFRTGLKPTPEQRRKLTARRTLAELGPLVPDNTPRPEPQAVMGYPEDHTGAVTPQQLMDRLQRVAAARSRTSMVPTRSNFGEFEQRASQIERVIPNPRQSMVPTRSGFGEFERRVSGLVQIPRTGLEPEVSRTSRTGMEPTLAPPKYPVSSTMLWRPSSREVVGAHYYEDASGGPGRYTITYETTNGMAAQIENTSGQVTRYRAPIGMRQAALDAWAADALAEQPQQPTRTYSRGMGFQVAPRTTAIVPEPAPAPVAPPSARGSWLSQTWGQLRSSRVAAIGVSSAMAVLDVKTLMDPRSTQEERDRSKFNLSMVGGSAATGLGAVWAGARGMSSRVVSGLGHASAALGLATIAPDAWKLAAGKTPEERQSGGWNYFVGAMTAVGVTAVAGAGFMVGVAALPAAAILAGAGLVFAGGMYSADYLSGGRISYGVGLSMQTGRDTIAAGWKMSVDAGASAMGLLGRFFDRATSIIPPTPKPSASGTPMTQVRDQIVVVGDETPGIVAAVAAARAGAQVTLVAPLKAKGGQLGGLLTRGGLAYLDRNQQGLKPSNPFYGELMSRMGVKQVSFDPDKGDKVLRQMLAEAGVKIVYEDPRNTQVTSKYTIDATRSAVFARQQGAKFFRGFETAGAGGEDFTLAVSPIFKLKGVNAEDWLRFERKLDPKSLTKHYAGTDYLDVRSDAIGQAYHKWRGVQYNKDLKPGAFVFDRGNIAILPDGSLSVNGLLFGVGAKRAIELGDRNRIPTDIRDELKLVERFFKEKVSDRTTLVAPRELYVRHTGNVETTEMISRSTLAESPGPFVGTYALDVRGIHGPGSLGQDIGGPVIKYRYGTEGTQVKDRDDLYVVGAAAGYKADVVGIGRIEEFNIGKAGLLGKALAEKLTGVKTPMPSAKPEPAKPKLSDADRAAIMGLVRKNLGLEGSVLPDNTEVPMKRGPRPRKEISLPVKNPIGRAGAVDHVPGPYRPKTKVTVSNGKVHISKPTRSRQAAVDHTPQGGGIVQGAIDHLYNWAVRAGL
jgi:murein DD-endopeptidase MepM/ murein hydrolase activator NlpD